MSNADDKTEITIRRIDPDKNVGQDFHVMAFVNGKAVFDSAFSDPELVEHQLEAALAEWLAEVE